MERFIDSSSRRMTLELQLLTGLCLTDLQDFESVREEEGRPYPSQALPKAPRHRSTAMGRTNYFVDGRC